MKLLRLCTPYVLIVGILTLGACRSARESVRPESLTPTFRFPTIQRSVLPVNSPTVIHPKALAEIDSILVVYIRAQAFPGAVVSVGRGDDVVKVTGYGRYTYRSGHLVQPESSFDLASLTKVIATTTAVMILYEEGHLHIDVPVSRYLSAFRNPERQSITIRHLLTHTSGLPSWRPFYKDGITTREAVMDSILSTPLLSKPGEEYLYSDFGMISLALVIEAITGESFDYWCAQNIFVPLGMNSTGFRGIGVSDSTVVPTELDNYFRHRLIQGEVHDETAWILGGVAGHAGLFSTALDLARFARMMALKGRYNGKEFLQESTIDLFTTVTDTSLSTRALGWDTRNLGDEPSSAGQYFGPRSYGHTGFTGTSLWIDPDSEAWVILLTNRVYPSRDEYERFRGLRGQVADAVYKAFFRLIPKP